MAGNGARQRAGDRVAVARVAARQNVSGGPFRCSAETELAEAGHSWDKCKRWPRAEGDKKMTERLPSSTSVCHSSRALALAIAMLCSSVAGCEYRLALGDDPAEGLDSKLDAAMSGPATSEQTAT